MSDPRICILVLNWNGAEDTLECLESLQNLTYPGADAVVIDNGSGDDSVSMIKQEYPDIQILELETNLFYGGGNNAGLSWAATHDYDYVLFLNNDTTVEADFIEPLLAAFDKSGNVGMSAPLMCYASEPNRIWYAGGHVNLWTGTVAHSHIRDSVEVLTSELQFTDYITGCCLMMPVKLASELEGFDPDFKMYGEDVDLSLRCRQAGYQLAFVPSSRIYHKVSASVGGEFGMKKMLRKLLGLIQVYARHAAWYQWPIILLSQLIILPFGLTKLVKYSGKVEVSG